MIHPVIQKLAPHYLAILLLVTGATAAIASATAASPSTTADGPVSSGGPGSIAIVQEALTIAAHLQPNSDPYHRLTRGFQRVPQWDFLPYSDSRSQYALPT
jgi:hypothetical protein